MNINNQTLSQNHQIKLKGCKKVNPLKINVFVAGNLLLPHRKLHVYINCKQYILHFKDVTTTLFFQVIDVLVSSVG